MIDHGLTVWLKDGLTPAIEHWLEDRIGKRAKEWFVVTESVPVDDVVWGKRLRSSRTSREGVILTTVSNAVLVKLTFGGQA